VFYPQDGGESQLALKLRHSHSMHRLAVRARDGETRRGANASRARAMFVRLSAAAPAGQPAGSDRHACRWEDSD